MGKGQSPLGVGLIQQGLLHVEPEEGEKEGST